MTTEKMSDLQALKQMLNLSVEYVKIRELEVDKPYTITSGSIVSTQYGPKVRLLLNAQYSLFLPDRYANMLSDEKLSILIENKTRIVYKGTKELLGKKTKHVIEFV